MNAAEQELLERFSGTDDRAPQAIFVLGSPRTGSTLVYQLIVRVFGLPYIANLTNEAFAEAPIVGLALQRAACRPGDVNLESRYGKTTGAWQPSEGSAVMSRWFGGGHPSQRVSQAVKPEMAPHFRNTLSAARGLFGQPLVVKNAWNCFRVRHLAETLPLAAFVWIRRDIAGAAKSDLRARQAVHGDLTQCNSATPANVEALRQRPVWEQVVENQYEFNSAIETDLGGFARQRHAVLWYEDLCRNPGDALSEIAVRCFTRDGLKVNGSMVPEINPPNCSPEDSSGFDQAIDEYVEENKPRLGPFCYRAAGSRPTSTTLFGCAEQRS